MGSSFMSGINRTTKRNPRIDRIHGHTLESRDTIFHKLLKTSTKLYYHYKDRVYKYSSTRQDMLLWRRYYQSLKVQL